MNDRYQSSISLTQTVDARPYHDHDLDLHQEQTIAYNNN